MLDRLTKLREERANSEKGFTLIELLVVVVIIGILIAIAIPVYLNYENGAKDKSTESDVRGAISATEQCITDGNGPPNTAGASSASPVHISCGNAGFGSIPLSSGTDLMLNAFNATAPTHYVILGQQSSTNNVYCYDSATGGSVCSGR